MKLSKLPYSQAILPPDSWREMTFAELVRKAHLAYDMSQGICFIPAVLTRTYRRMDSIIREACLEESFSEVQVPLLMRTELVRKSGKYEKYGSEFFEVGRDSRYILSGTTEEMFLQYLSRGGLESYNQLPIRAFYFGEIFRNIKRPEGLYKGREFYGHYALSLDADSEGYIKSLAAFEAMCEKVWRLLGIQNVVYKIKSNDGLAVEYLSESLSGDRTFDKSVVIKRGEGQHSDKTLSSDKKLSSLAMAYIFSEADNFGLAFTNSEGRKAIPVVGTYAIGIQRCLATMFDNLRDESGINLPKQVRPFDIAIIPIDPNNQSQNEILERLYISLSKAGLSVALDDRRLMLSERLRFADFVGIPYRMVFGVRDMKRQVIEIRERGDRDKFDYISLTEAVESVKKLVREE
jgi:prolyl-tRNA synthetase